MSEAEIMAKLAHALSDRMLPSIPLAVDLWDIATVAQYLERDTKVKREQIDVLLDFPKAVRRPTGNGRAPAFPLQLMDDAMMAAG